MPWFGGRVSAEQAETDRGAGRRGSGVSASSRQDNRICLTACDSDTVPARHANRAQQTHTTAFIWLQSARGGRTSHAACGERTCRSPSLRCERAGDRVRMTRRGGRPTSRTRKRGREGGRTVSRAATLASACALVSRSLRSSPSVSLCLGPSHPLPQRCKMRGEIGRTRRGWRWRVGVGAGIGGGVGWLGASAPREGLQFGALEVCALLLDQRLALPQLHLQLPSALPLRQISHKLRAGEAQRR